MTCRPLCPWAAVGALLIGGCVSGPGGDPTELSQPLLGSAGETRFYMASPTGELDLRDVVAVATVLRRYKTLDAAETKLVQLAVQRNLQGIIALEAKRIEAEPRIQLERQRIRAMPDRRAAARAALELEARVFREAAVRVADQLADLAAVPLRSIENRSIVAFAKIKKDQIEVAGAAYEIEGRQGAVGPGTKVPLPAEIAAELNVGKTAKATLLGSLAKPTRR